MLPFIQKPPISARQKKAALAVAGTIDFLQIILFPTLLPGYAVDTALDVIAAIILVAICGFKWQFALAFTLELFPFVDIFPTWTAVVVMLGSTSPESAQPVNVSVAVPPLQVAPVREKDVVDVEAVAVPPVQPPTLPKL